MTPSPTRSRWLLLLIPVAVATAIVAVPRWFQTSGEQGTAHIGTNATAELRATELPRALDGSPITALAFSADGRIAVGTPSGNVEFREADGSTTGATVIPLFNTPITALTVSRDGAKFAAANDRTVYLADRATPLDGRTAHPFTASDPSSVGSLALSPRGDMLAVGVFGVKLYDTQTGVNVAELQQPPADYQGVYDDIAFSSDGNTLFAADGNTAAFWDVRTKALIRSITCDCHWDGTGSLVTERTIDGHAITRDVTTGAVVRDLTVTVRKDSYVLSAMATDDGKTLFAYTSDGQLSAWNNSNVSPYARLGFTDARLSLEYGNEGSFMHLSPTKRYLIVGIQTANFIESAHAYEYVIYLVSIA